MIRQNFLLSAMPTARWIGCWSLCWLSGCSGSGSSAASNGPEWGGSPSIGGQSSTSGGAASTTLGGALGQVGGTSSATDAQSGSSAMGGGTSSNAGGNAQQGGRSNSATSTGGTSASGNPSGGTPSGGSSLGGTSAGGINSSGNGAIGAASAGKAAGGAGKGGSSSGTTKATGGASATGGNAAGAAAGVSFASGGTSQGGISTGGTRTAGGTNQGGTTSGGGSSSNVCPAGITQTITVAKDGSGQYSSVQAGVDSIPSGSSAHIRINIKAGTYTEKLTIANRTNLCLVGDGATTTILTYNDSNAAVGSTSGSASVFVSANDFSAAQLTFQNSYGAGSQAVALRTTGQRQQFLDCRLVGYQDTLYVHSGTQYFRNCYVQGNTDYVFGGATAILQNCEVRNVQSGSAVAAPNTASSTAYGIVFIGGQFTAASGVSNVALARPWGADGAAAFLNATLGSHISKAGFTSMSGNDPANARFGEYQSTGSGANASSRSAYQMTAAEAANYTIANTYAGAWTPSYSQ